jgi:hypothetical protein
MGDNDNQTRLNISLSKQTFWFSGQVSGWAMADIGQCRLFDNFQVTPPTGLKPFELSAATTAVHCVWAKKGSLWLESTLKLGGSFSTEKGASGSVQLTSGVHYAPMKGIEFVFGLTLDGTVDRDGFRGSVHLHDSGFVLTAPKSVWSGPTVGVYF